MNFKIIKPGNNLPVIAFLPGIGGTMKKWMNIYGKRKDFIGVYFDTPEQWHKTHMNEFLNILTPIATANASPLNVMGISNGACFALMLLAEGKIDRCVSIAGSLFQGQTVKKGKVVMVNGMLDNQVPYNGGEAHSVFRTGALNTFTDLSEGIVRYDTPSMIQYVSGENILWAVRKANHAVWPYVVKNKLFPIIDTVNFFL